MKRKAEGKDPANSIWPWSPGYRPQMERLSDKFPQVKRGAVISAVDLINGIGYYAGLRRITVEGATGLYDTNYENKVSRAVGPIYEAVKDWEEPVAISVLPDHPTPCELRTHTAEPIPFLIWHPGIEADEVRTFDEVAACEGSYGLMKEDEFINEFMSSTTE